MITAAAPTSLHPGELPKTHLKDHKKRALPSNRNTAYKIAHNGKVVHKIKISLWLFSPPLEVRQAPTHLAFQITCLCGLAWGAQRSAWKPSPSL